MSQLPSALQSTSVPVGDRPPQWFEWGVRAVSHCLISVKAVNKLGRVLKLCASAEYTVIEQLGAVQK